MPLSLKVLNVVSHDSLPQQIVRVLKGNFGDLTSDVTG